LDHIIKNRIIDPFLVAGFLVTLFCYWLAIKLGYLPSSIFAFLLYAILVMPLFGIMGKLSQGFRKSSLDND